MIGPPEADHAADFGAFEAVARGVALAQAGPAAVVQRNARLAAFDFVEEDFDLGDFASIEVRVAPFEDEARGRLPRL